MNVIVQRLERRDIEDAGLPERTFARYQLIDGTQERSQSLSASCRGSDQDMASLHDARPRLDLQLGRFPDLFHEPLRDQRMKMFENPITCSIHPT